MNKNPETTLASYLAAHPFLEETAGLYQTLQSVLQEAVVPVEFPEVAACQQLVKDGVPLLQQEKLQRAVVKVAAGMLPDVLAAFKGQQLPAAMAKALADWSVWAGETELQEIQQFFTLLLKQQDEELAAFITKVKLPKASIRLVGWALIDALVPAELKDAQVWREAGWRENYCPVCGRQPVMAQLKKETEANGAERFLRCGGCGTLWHFTRIGCVYCGNKDTQELPILLPEKGQVRIDTCDECHSYIKTYVGHGREDIYLQDWATLHLDVLAEEKGLAKHGSVLI